MLPSRSSTAHGAVSLDQILTLLVEVLYGILFAGALIDYVRRRDPLAREVALAFLGLASLLVVRIVESATGELPPPFDRVPIVLLLTQPVFTLRLIAHIRPLPRWLLPATYLGSIATLTPGLVIQQESPFFQAVLVGAFGVFVLLAGIAGAFFLLEARWRKGSARVRLAIAGVSSVLLAAAILLLLAVLAGPASDVGTEAALVLAAIAAIGYGAAFMPPAFVRRGWQSEAGYTLGRRLLETADATDPEAAWARYVEMARDLTGADAAVVRDIRADVRAAVGLEPAPVPVEEVARLVERADRTVDVRPEELGGIWVDIGERSRAKFMTIVRIEPRGAPAPAVLILYSRRRSLFADDDRDLLAALGTQAAILVERARLASDLHATVEQLRAASAAKSDFLASMSHELRTPLNAIIGFSELMRMEGGSREQITVPREWVDHVARAGQHLLDLINDVLDLAKVEAGRLELQQQTFDADAAIVEWVGGVRPLADRKRIRLHAVGEVGTVVADRGRMRQVVYNLLSNAIKFTPEDGEVRVELERTGSAVCLSVVDTGIGIAPEDQESVFEEFRQVGDVEERQPGTGLGLALTRRLVEAHGGRIELESAKGSGSTFRIRLPQPAIVQSDEPEGDAAAGMPVAIGGLEVLVIEDDPSAVGLLRQSLEPAGWRVRVASDGEAGLLMANEHRPDAIVLDVQLPRIDGWDVLRALKADAELRDVPVLMLTVVDEREVGLALGASDYLVKPVERGALLSRLARYTFTTKVRKHAVRILVVDDDPAAVELVASALEPEGFTVVRAFGGGEGLELARAEPPDLVICDLVMPELDGFGLVAALKADPTTRDAPILVVTGHPLTSADKRRLNGDILGIVEKGAGVADGLRRWLGPIARRRQDSESAA